MNDKLRTAAVLVLLLANGACATPPAAPIFDPDPMLHPPGGRIVFNRMCADEEPYQVKAYARMESHDGRARAVVAVLAGYRATGGKTVHIGVRIQRLKLDAGKEWRNADYAMGLTGRSARRVVEGPLVGSYIGGPQGQEPANRSLGTDETGTSDWITFLESEDRTEDFDRFYHIGPELDVTARELEVQSPRDEFDLALVIRNESNGRTFELRGPRVRIPERLWAMNPPAPQTLGLAQILNPAQEGGLFSTLGRAWKYRECIEERKAAKRFLGPYTRESSKREDEA